MLYKTDLFVFNSATGLLSKGGVENKLTNKQGKLLVYLFEHPNTIISKETLMEEVWGRVVTGNTIDQVILTLRNYSEDQPSKPKTIITHFGLGISFEANVTLVAPQDKTNEKEAVSVVNLPKPSYLKFKFILPLFLIALLIFVFDYFRKRPQELENIGDKKILILPFEINTENISETEQSGMKSLLRSSFKNLRSEEKLIFDETSHSVKQAVEKHWKLNKNLVILHSNVTKNGDVYEAVFELSDGIKTIGERKFTANNLSDILNGQIGFINTLSNTGQSIALTPNQLLIEASGQKNLGNLNKAEALFKQILLENDDNYQARFELAETYFLQKKYKKSLSNFEALKFTPAYSSMGVDIELNISEIQFKNNNFEEVISSLKAFLASHNNLHANYAAKISLQMGRAYHHLGNSSKSIEFYKKAIVHIDEQLNPLIFSQSYYGQGKALLSTVIDDSVVKLFEKALKYAKLAGNLRYQTLALNKLSHIAMSRYKWDEAVALNKKAIQLLELNDDKNETAKALTTLTTILNLQGKFSDAKEVNDRLATIANEIDSDALRLMFLHFDAIIAMNKFNWDYAQQQINAQYQLAESTNNYSMMLNNAFTALELMLLTEQTDGFLHEWNKRSAFIKEKNFTRFQLYLDYYLARYYAKINQDKKAMAIINTVTEQAMSSKDYKIMVDMQHELVKIQLKKEAKKALNILNSLEQYNPHPNPQLELQAMALHNLGRDIEALSIMNQAKLVYHESWTHENQTLLATIRNSID